MSTLSTLGRGRARAFLASLSGNHRDAASFADLASVSISRNAVGGARHARRIAETLPESSVKRLHTGRGHAALTAAVLITDQRRFAAEPGYTDVAVWLRTTYLSGKRGTLSSVLDGAAITTHAIGRFFERCPKATDATLLAAITEAGEVAEAVRLTAILPIGAERMAEGGGIMPLALPGGPGLFLGHLRLMLDPRAGLVRLIFDLQTWVDERRLDGSQLSALAALRKTGEMAAKGAGALVQHIALALEDVSSAESGDNRMARGGHLVGSPPDQVRLALDDIAGQVSTVSAALHLGLIEPDEMAKQALMKPADYNLAA